MSEPSSGAKSPRELRSFGLLVGGAFLILGSISWWRGHVLPPRVLWALGGFLFLGGALAPRALAPVERGWMKFAAGLGWFNTRLLLSLIFFLVLTPIGLVMRLFRDPMDRRIDPSHTTHWTLREPEGTGIERYRMPF